jgi:hypothetical protein
MMLSSCAKTIYIEELTSRLEPVRTVDFYLSTPTQIFHTNTLTFEEGYFVHYNQNRVMWYPSRFSYKEISLPLEQVSKVSYRSRLRGVLTGFAVGYILGYGAYNLGVLGKPGQPFLSQFNQSVSLGFGTVMGIGGFWAGLPVTYYFKYKDKRARIAKDFIINPKGEY